MALVPVGEHGVTISINGTERINDQIRDDTTYNLNESFNTKINVNGNQRVNTTQNSDETYNITESLNSTINVNGSNEGTFSQTSDTAYNINTSSAFNSAIEDNPTNPQYSNTVHFMAGVAVGGGDSNNYAYVEHKDGNGNRLGIRTDSRLNRGGEILFFANAYLNVTPPVSVNIGGSGASGKSSDIKTFSFEPKTNVDSVTQS